MNLNAKGFLYSVAATGLFVSTGAFAANPTFRLSHSVLNYGMTTTTTKTTPTGGTEGPEAKVETGTLVTFPSSLEIATFLDGWAIYAYPQTTGGALWVGWAGIENMEVGPTFGILNTSTVDTAADGAKTTSGSSNFVVGAYVYYSLGLGGTNLEINFNPYFKSSAKEQKSQSKSGAEVKTVDSSGSGIGVSLDLTVPVTLAENFEFAPGLSITYDSINEEEKAAASTEKGKKEGSALAIGLNIAKFRYTF